MAAEKEAMERIHTDVPVVLHAEKVDKIYPGTKALDGVSFDVYKGKVNVLIGENGAGKSTLMKLIAGIEQPSAGEMTRASASLMYRRHVRTASASSIRSFPSFRISACIRISSWRERLRRARSDSTMQRMCAARRKSSRSLSIPSTRM